MSGASSSGTTPATSGGIPWTISGSALKRDSSTPCGRSAALWPAGAVVLEEDPRWAGYGGKALYVHNLAASLHFSGAGTELLRRCLALAAERGQDYLRLDCARDNPVLHDYYERFGFRFVAPVEDQGYLGDLLQYPLGSRD